MTVVGAAAIPAAPLLLPDVSPDQPQEVRPGVRRLRELASDALDAVPAVDAYVLVGSGKRGIYDRGQATLAPLGADHARISLPIAQPVIEHLSRLTQYPMFRGDTLDVETSVLALAVHAVRGEVPILPVSVPRAADFDVLVSIGASIREAVGQAGMGVAVICASDLSAGLDGSSPAGRIEGARAWDDQVVEACRAGDLAGLRDLGPDEASRVQAHGWASLAVFHGVCAGRLRVECLGYEAPRGVGYVVLRALTHPASGSAASR
jgi:hypothetical protein